MHTHTHTHTCTHTYTHTHTHTHRHTHTRPDRHTHVRTNKGHTNLPTVTPPHQGATPDAHFSPQLREARAVLHQNEKGVRGHVRHGQRAQRRKRVGGQRITLYDLTQAKLQICNGEQGVRSALRKGGRGRVRNKGKEWADRGLRSMISPEPNSRSAMVRSAYCGNVEESRCKAKKGNKPLCLVHAFF